jgi:peptidoglycan hydrolase FlgJ
MTTPSALSMQLATPADSRSLDSLKRDAARDPRAAAKQAAQQFEALFMQMVLKSMRDATPQSGLMDSEAGNHWRGMLDQTMAQKVSAGGTGLADVIARQLMRQMGAEGDVTSQGAAAIQPVTSPPRAVEAPRSATSSASIAPAAHSDEQRSFFARLAPHARAAQAATGIPADFVLAQAALESGWGRQEIRGDAAGPSHNLFGIKAGSQWAGRTVDVMTTEYIGGVPVKRVEKFRAYESYADAFRDWSQLIGRNPRYAQVVAAGNDAAGFAQGLQKGGYATDPNYATKLLRTIESVRAAGA